MSVLFKCRQVDKYDGQSIYSGGKVVYDLGNYLGGGASGSVYQGFDPVWQGTDKSVAIKILNPLGYKNLVFGNINQHSVAWKGLSLSSEQIHGKVAMTSDNVWWLLHPTTKSLFAAFEDPQRKQLRELPLTKCVEIWGMNPLNFERISEAELDKINYSGNQSLIDGKEYKIPIVSPKYLKFLRNRLHVCREMNNMVQIGEHPNIVELLEVLELVQDSKTTLFLVLELINGGELFDRVKAGAVGGNVEEFARRYFNQLLSGLEYCHKRGIVHRDLKPENLLLSDPTETAILKIADFGLSAVIFAAESNEENTDGLAVRSQNGQNSPGSKIPKQDNRANVFRLQSSSATSSYSTPPKSTFTDIAPASFRRLKSVVGSPHYIAPEIASDDPAGYDGRKVDMWSTGVILYSLFTGSLPFGSDLVSCSRFRRYKHWLNNEYVTSLKDGKDAILPSWFWPSNISPLVTNLLVGLLQCDPTCRLSAAEAILHPWCQGMSYEEYKASQHRDVSCGMRISSVVDVLSPIRNPNAISTVARLTPLLGDADGSPERFRADGKNRLVVNLPVSLSTGTVEGCSQTRFQYDWTAIQEQQRKKEAEALELYSRQVGSLKLSNEDLSGNNRCSSSPKSAIEQIVEVDHQPI